MGAASGQVIRDRNIQALLRFVWGQPGIGMIVRLSSVAIAAIALLSATMYPVTELKAAEGA